MINLIVRLQLLIVVVQEVEVLEVALEVALEVEDPLHHRHMQVEKQR